MADTYKIECEHTDTFGGEANYCWVSRQEIELPQDTPENKIRRAIKSAFGMIGVRGEWSSYGDSWEFRPRGMCQIIFGRVVY